MNKPAVFKNLIREALVRTTWYALASSDEIDLAKVVDFLSEAISDYVFFGANDDVNSHLTGVFLIEDTVRLTDVIEKLISEMLESVVYDFTGNSDDKGSLQRCVAVFRLYFSYIENVEAKINFNWFEILNERISDNEIKGQFFSSLF